MTDYENKYVTSVGRGVRKVQKKCHILFEWPQKHKINEPVHHRVRSNAVEGFARIQTVCCIRNKAKDETPQTCLQ
jgi:hypothetical protein